MNRGKKIVSRRICVRSAVLFLIWTTVLRPSESNTSPFAGIQTDSDSPELGEFQKAVRPDEPRIPDLLPGKTPYRVGFRQAFLDDNSRPFGERKSRPVRISVWYPAVPDSEPPLQLGDYVNLHRNGDMPDGVPAFREWAGRIKTEESKIESILALTNRACHNATLASGRFPLIVYAASFRGPAYENFAMFEYLAGQGFVIISVPSVGADAAGMTMDRIGVESQLRDLELAHDLALELQSVDRDRVGAMGYSLGAVPAALLSLHDGIRACASIDGAMGYTYALLGDALDDTEAKLKAAYLQLTQRPFESMPLDNRFYDFHAAMDAYHFQWKKLDHYDFGSMTLLLKSARPEKYEPSAQEIKLRGANDTPYPERFQAYRQMVQIIYLFFDAHLRDSDESKNRLQALVTSILPEYGETFSIRTMK